MNDTHPSWTALLCLNSIISARTREVPCWAPEDDWTYKAEDAQWEVLAQTVPDLPRGYLAEQSLGDQVILAGLATFLLETHRADPDALGRARADDRDNPVVRRVRGANLDLDKKFFLRILVLETAPALISLVK